MNKPVNSLADFEDARSGDEEAMNRMLKVWRERLKAYARHQLRQVHARVDTSDVVQEGLIQAWQNMDTFQAKSEGEFRSWTRKVAKGRLANARRKHMAERRTVKSEVSPKAGMLERIGTEDGLQGTHFAPEDVERLRLAIGQLPDRLQLIVCRRYFDNATFEAIAAEIGSSAGGARTMCLRAIKQLRRAMKNPRRDSDSGSTDFSARNPTD